MTITRSKETRLFNSQLIIVELKDNKAEIEETKKKIEAIISKII